MLFTCGRELRKEKEISVFENIWIRVDGTSGVRLVVELYCVIVVKHVAFIAVCATLIMAVTLTSLLLSFCSSVSGCGCGFRIEQKYLRIDGFGQRKTRICIPLSTPLYSGLSLYKRRYHLSPLGLPTVNPVVLTRVKWWAGLNENKEVSFSKNSWTIELCLSGVQKKGNSCCACQKCRLHLYPLNEK